MKMDCIGVLHVLKNWSIHCHILLAHKVDPGLIAHNVVHWISIVVVQVDSCDYELSA